MGKSILFAFYPRFVDWSHGIALLSAICKNHNIETDLILLSDMPAFIEKIETGKYDFIGFSCTTKSDYDQSVPFMIEAANRGYKVLVGGVYIQRAKPDLKFAKVCTGDGEYLPLFINYGTEDVLDSYVCKDLNRLPLPDYDLFEGIPYNREVTWLPADTKYLPYYSSRGCPFRCKFCEVHFQQPVYQRVRYKVGEDLDILIPKYQPDVLVLGDALSPYYNKRWRDSWESIKHPFVTYLRADIKESELRWFHDRGMIGCFFGVESGNEVYRNQVLGKHLHDKDIFRTVAILNEMGVPFMAAYMRGTPDETWELQGETAKFMETIGGYPIGSHYESLAVG